MRRYDEYADAVMGGCIKRAEQYYKETYEKGGETIKS